MNILLAPVKRQLKWLVDITVGYPEASHPLDLLNVCLGIRPPCTTTVYYRRFPIEDVPHEIDQLTEWMYDRLAFFAACTKH